jgi:hypothetical protein
MASILRRDLLTSLILILTTIPSVTGVCSACASYVKDMSTCSNLFSSAVSNTAIVPINSNEVSCMCVSGSGLTNMVNCYQCNQASGSDLSLLEMWIVACDTVSKSSVDAAVNCWNSDHSLCIAVDGVEAPSAVSAATANHTASQTNSSAATSPTITPATTSSNVSAVGVTGTTKSGGVKSTLTYEELFSLLIAGATVFASCFV